MQEEKKINIAQKKNKKRVILVIAFVLLFSVYIFVSLRGEYLEILEIGENYLEIFNQNLKYRTIAMVTSFLTLFVIIYITNKIIKKGLRIFFEEEKIAMPKLPNKSIAFIISTLITIVTLETIVEKATIAFNSAWFGINDPIFNLDIGFYMFQKPFIEFMITYFIVLIIALTIYIVIYYIAVFNIYFENGINIDTLKKNTFFKQIICNIVLLSIGIAGITLIKTQDVLFGKFLKINNELDISLFGAGFTDVTIKLWGYRILAILMVICIISAIKYIKKSKIKKAILSLTVIPVYLVGLFIVMVLFDWLFVKNNELDKQKQYIAYNLENTKNAYNINIEEKEIENSGTITYEDVTNYQEVLENIAIMNKEITLQNLEQYQSNAGYYSFKNTQIQNYKINGENTLVYISPREIESQKNRTYNNKTYEYTHGYGVVVSLAVATDELGNAKYLQKDFEEEQPKIEITQPRIYFGLNTNDTIVTNSKNKTEFDYPVTSDSNKENVYDGKAGVELNFLDRLILGVKQKNIKIAFSTNVTKESKILTNRNVIQRAKKIMPYLIYDEEPYMVITEEGRLVWVVDAYTISNQYPYSQETIIEVNGLKQTINYIRNSVKVLVDAYDGTVEFYITDRTDPIVMAYRNIYPSLFKDLDENIPNDIQEHIVYSKYLYQIQAEQLAFYHKIQTEVLYRGDDIWNVAKQNKTKINSIVGTSIEPYYTMVKTVDNESSTLGLVLAYTPLDKQNIISYLVGTYDIQNKSKLTLYKFKSGSNVLGPMQLEMQIEEDDTISKELDTVMVNGTSIIKNMIIVPINNSLLYVEPIYQVKLNESQVPILKKVIVASGTKVSIGNNLEEALKNLLSQYAVNIEVQSTDSIEDLINAIIKANHNLMQSSSNNDWEMIGKDMDKLQSLINQLEQLMVKEEEKEKTENKSNIIDEITNTLFKTEPQV